MVICVNIAERRSQTVPENYGATILIIKFPVISNLPNIASQKLIKFLLICIHSLTEKYLEMLVFHKMLPQLCLNQEFYQIQSSVIRHYSKNSFSYFCRIRTCEPFPIPFYIKNITFLFLRTMSIQRYPEPYVKFWYLSKIFFAFYKLVSAFKVNLRLEILGYLLYLIFRRMLVWRCSPGWELALEVLQLQMQHRCLQLWAQFRVFLCCFLK